MNPPCQIEINYNDKFSGLNNNYLRNTYYYLLLFIHWFK